MMNLVAEESCHRENQFRYSVIQSGNSIQYTAMLVVIIAVHPVLYPSVKERPYLNHKFLDEWVFLVYGCRYAALFVSGGVKIN
jgi:hypothetical protein